MKVTSTVNFAAVERKIKAAVGLYANTAAQKLEGEAKRNKIWIDRTSVAKNTIQGSSGWRGDNAVVTLAGNVDYFIFLELAMGKKYAILAPTMQMHSNEILSGYKKVIG